MARQHIYESTADSLAQWLDETAEHLADGLREGGRAPFAAPASEADKLRYYEAQFFNPDGSPNAQGRIGELNRLGIAPYAQALAQVQKARLSRGGPVGEEVGGDDGA